MSASEPILIKNSLVFRKGVFRKADVAVEEGRISAVLEDGSGADKTGVVMDGSGKAIVPGFVNCHTHAAMTLFRGYADDMVLHEWLEKKIWPLEAKLDGEAVYWGTKLACLEMLKSGITFFADMYFFCEDVARAASDMGMRACISSAFFDFFDENRLEERLKKVEKDVKALKKYDRILPSVGPHAVYTVSLEGLRRSAEIAERENIPLHFHLAETRKEVEDFRRKHGRGIISVLDDIGFLSPRLIAAHSVWLEKEEIRVMAEKGVTAVHCAASNMKLCVGRAIDFRAMRDSNLNVALGTDGAASNNSLNFFEEMKIAALLQKFYYGDPTLMRADEVFDMATKNGGRAFSLKVGEIEEGYLADLVLIDLDAISMSPGHNLVSNIVYSANPGCVDTVIVDGNIVIENGLFGGSRDKEIEIIRKANEVAIRLAEEAD